MELVERQLASLTGLVQTALTGAVGVHVQQPPRADSNGPDATTGLALSSEEGNKWFDQTDWKISSGYCLLTILTGSITVIT